MSDVLAATLVAPGELELRSYPYPQRIEPGSVLLRMLASGICGTDKHTFRGETEQYAGTDHARTTPFPIIQGHENVGVVEEIGAGGALASDATPLRAGDRVVPAPNWPCGACAPCLRGFPYYLCRRLENYGNSLTSDRAPHLFGGWAEYLYLFPGTPIFRVPDELPLEVDPTDEQHEQLSERDDPEHRALLHQDVQVRRAVEVGLEHGEQRGGDDRHCD